MHEGVTVDMLNNTRVNARMVYINTAGGCSTELCRRPDVNHAPRAEHRAFPAGVSRTIELPNQHLCGVREVLLGRVNKGESNQSPERRVGGSAPLPAYRARVFTANHHQAVSSLVSFFWDLSRLCFEHVVLT